MAMCTGGGTGSSTETQEAQEKHAQAWKGQEYARLLTMKTIGKGLCLATTESGAAN